MTQNPTVNQGYLIRSPPKLTSQTNKCDEECILSGAHTLQTYVYMRTLSHLSCMDTTCQFCDSFLETRSQHGKYFSTIISHSRMDHHVALPHHHDWCPNQQHAQRTGHGRISVPKKGTARPRPMRLQSDVGESGASSTSLFCNLFETCRSWKECHIVCSGAVIDDPDHGKWSSRYLANPRIRDPGILAAHA